jgi:hypothetical protein
MRDRLAPPVLTHDVRGKGMALDVRSVENLLGIPVPYAYAVKAGPWVFLTGP